MISQQTRKKISENISKAVFHLLLYIAGCTVYFIIGISVVFSKLSFVTFGSFLSSALNFIFLGLGWILFTVIWIFFVHIIDRTFNEHKIRSFDNVQVEGTNLTRKELEAFFFEFDSQIATLKGLMVQVKDSAIRKKISSILETIKEIYSIFEDEPREINRGRLFIDHYLNAAIKIVRKYVAFTKYKDRSESARKSIENIEKNLDMISTGFENQLEKLLQHDEMDIDVEIKALKSALKSEGLN